MPKKRIRIKAYKRNGKLVKGHLKTVKFKAKSRR